VEQAEGINRRMHFTKEDSSLGCLLLFLVVLGRTGHHLCHLVPETFHGLRSLILLCSGTQR
jgi:hypothetical protein